MPYVDLLTSLPKTKRDIKARSVAKDPEVVRVAKQFGKEYFDGDRRYGYGGYHYDGRWVQVAKDIIKFFELVPHSIVLDVGCGKGFLVKDFADQRMDAYGIDISSYAIENGVAEKKHRLFLGNAKEIKMPDNICNCVVSVNTIHNLPRHDVIQALREIQRVSKGNNSYVVVDSYNTPEEKELFLEWVLTAETHGYPWEWEEIFREAGYTGYYSWNILS